MIYGILNADRSFREWREFAEPPRHRAGMLLPQAVDPVPSFDPETHKAQPAAPVVEEDRVRLTWEIVPLSDDEAREVDDRRTLQQLRNVYQALRDGNGTAAERLTRVERVTAHMLKRLVREFGMPVD